MPSNVTTATKSKTQPISAHLAHLFDQSKAAPSKPRLIFALDATASRQPVWDLAAALTYKMLAEVAGKLDVQLAYYSGQSNFVATRWISSAAALSTLMSSVRCSAGLTQLERLMRHVARENERSRVSAAVFVGDAFEEVGDHVILAAKQIDQVPVFMFQEGHDEHVAQMFRCIANTTKGAYSRFDEASAARLGDLLRAVAAYATGGRDALQALGSESAKLLLTQVRK
jgi:hypothetical protein